MDEVLARIEANTEAILSNQSELDARAAAIQGTVDGLVLAVDGVQQAVDDLKNQPPEALDFTALDAAMANLGAAKDDLATSDPGVPGVDPTPEPPADV